MSTTEMPTEVLPPDELEAPLPVAPTVPGVSNGLGTQAALTGVIGAVAAFIIAWVQDGLSPSTVALGVAAAGLLAAWYAGRSWQAKTIIDKTITAYQQAPDLGDVGGIPPDWTPPLEGEAAVSGPEQPPVEG
jgi:hypothetical protein